MRNPALICPLIVLICNGLSIESGESGKRPHFDIVMIDESLGYLGNPPTALAVSTKTYGGGSNGFGHATTAASSSSSGGDGKGMNSGYHGGSSSSNGHSHALPHSSFSDDNHMHISSNNNNGEGNNTASVSAASSSNGGIAFQNADTSGRSISSGSTSSKANSKAFGVGALVTIIRSVFGNSVFLGCTAGI